MKVSTKAFNIFTALAFTAVPMHAALANQEVLMNKVKTIQTRARSLKQASSAEVEIHFGGQAFAIYKEDVSSNTLTKLVATGNMHMYQQAGPQQRGAVKISVNANERIVMKLIHDGMAKEMKYGCPKGTTSDPRSGKNGACVYKYASGSYRPPNPLPDVCPVLDDLYNCFNWDGGRIFLFKFKVNDSARTINTWDGLTSSGWTINNSALLSDQHRGEMSQVGDGWRYDGNHRYNVWRWEPEESDLVPSETSYPTTTPTITATEEIDISHCKVEIYQDCPNAAGCGSQCTYVPNWDRSRTCAWNKCNHDYTASDPGSWQSICGGIDAINVIGEGCMAQLRQGSNISVLYKEGLNGVWNTNYPSGQRMGDNANQVRIQLDPVVTTLPPTQSPTTTPTMTPSEIPSARPSSIPSVVASSKPSLQSTLPFFFSGSQQITKSVEGKPDAVVVAPPTDYSLKFTIEPKGVVSGWGSIIHFSAGGNCCEYGKRVPGIWFYPGSTKLLVATGDNSKVHYQYIKNLAINKKHDIEVRVLGSVCTVYLNRVVAAQKTIGSRSQLDKVDVYIGDPWHKAANAVISDISLTPFPATS